MGGSREAGSRDLRVPCRVYQVSPDRCRVCQESQGQCRVCQESRVQCLVCQGWDSALDAVEAQFAEGGSFVAHGASPTDPNTPGVIQTAVDAGGAGARLLIESGTYAEQTFIDQDGVALIGCSQGGFTWMRLGSNTASPTTSASPTSRIGSISSSAAKLSGISLLTTD